MTKIKLLHRLKNPALGFDALLERFRLTPEAVIQPTTYEDESLGRLVFHLGGKLN